MNEKLELPIEVVERASRSRGAACFRLPQPALRIRHVRAIRTVPVSSVIAVNGWRPREVLYAGKRFSQTPGDDYAVAQLLHVAGAGHARLEEDAERRNCVDKPARGVL